MFRRASKSVRLDEHLRQTQLLSDWVEAAEDENAELRAEIERLKADVKRLGKFIDWQAETNLALHRDVTRLHEANAKLKADLAASEALLYETDEWRAATARALNAVAAERDELLEQIAEAVSALAV